MTKPVATQELINETAEVLKSEGAEVSVIAVQRRIGGGSFSTIKRYLDLWRSQHDATAAIPELPMEIDTKGREWIRALWALASQLAQRQAQSIRDEAAAAVAKIRLELSEALSEVSRLEQQDSDKAATLVQIQEQLRASELALIEAKTQAQRLPQLESALMESHAALAAAQQQSQEKAVEAGRLSGEVEALRGQIDELLARLTPN
jgi:chromosome segregation ATPase